MATATAKTTSLTFRVESIANTVEVLIWDYCGRWIAIPEEGPLFDKGLRLLAEAPADNREMKA